MNDIRGKYPAMRSLAFQAARDIDAVAEYVAALHDHVAEIDADAHLQAVGCLLLVHAHRVLDLDAATNCIHRASELREQTVTH